MRDIFNLKTVHKSMVNMFKKDSVIKENLSISEQIKNNDLLIDEKKEIITEINSDLEDKPLIDKEIPSTLSGSVKEKKKYSGLGFWDKRKLKKKPETSFLIRMFFSNGTCKEFVISTNKEIFTYKKRSYYLRYEDSRFNLTQNQYELTYFDDFAVPIQLKIEKLGDRAFWSVTSDNLKDIIKMNYIKALASSDEIDKFLKMVATISVISIFLIMWVVYSVSKINKFIIGV